MLVPLIIRELHAILVARTIAIPKLAIADVLRAPGVRCETGGPRTTTTTRRGREPGQPASERAFDVGQGNADE